MLDCFTDDTKQLLDSECVKTGNKYDLREQTTTVIREDNNPK